MSLSRPLSPYRVLELGTGAGALCARVLADLGADVVKVEPVAGDAMRGQGPAIDGTGISFSWFNANKRWATADLDDPATQRRLRAALTLFDVLIDGNGPGWLAAHGLDPDELRRELPELVIASVSHFGQTGPYRDWKGSALVDFALAGTLRRCGLPDQVPCAPPYLLPYVMGGVTAASAVVAALWERGRSGKGDWLDCSVLEAIQAQADWSAPGYSASGHMTKRAGAGPLFRLYAADDGWVRVINLSVKQWNAVKAWLANPPEIAGPEWDMPLYRAANPAILDQVFARHFKGRTKVELSKDGQEHGVGIVPIYSPSEVMEDEHFRVRGTFVPFMLPGGRVVRGPGAFVRMADTTPASLSAPSAPGQGLESLAGKRAAFVATGETGLPLAGVRVVEVGSGAVAPEITRILGELGADVIKIESMRQIDFMRLQGAGIEASSGWSSSNRNKRSVVLDLKHPDGRRVGQELAHRADIIVENNTACVMERMGIGYDEVSKANPKVVYVSSQAFGATGPSSRYGGFGPTNQAVSGTSYLWNHPSPEKPEGVQVIHPDHLLGRMGALAAIAALDERRRGGKGQHIDLGQAEFAIACVAEAFMESDASGRSVEPRGNESPIGAPHGVFPCLGEDQWIAITVESDEEWERLAGVVGDASWDDTALATVEGRLARRELLEAQLGAWTSQLPAVQAMRRLQGAGVPAGAAYSTVEVLADVHVAERGFFKTVTHPVLGTLRMEGVPFKAQTLTVDAARRAPLFGEHTREVLQAWLGLADAELARLDAAGALK